MNEQKQITISATVEEAQVLVNLLDCALKAVGMPAARAVVIWAERVQKVINDANTQHPKQEPVATADEKNPG